MTPGVYKRNKDCKDYVERHRIDMTELNRQKSANEGLYESYKIVMKEKLSMKEDFDFLNKENSKSKFLDRVTLLNR